jgi:ABC-type antimicrobial peptide transport system permease subunit
VFQADLVARVTVAAFGLNAIVLVVLSACSLAVVYALAARQRQIEFGVLRAMGLRGRQLLCLLAIESSLLLLLGLAVGTGVGYGLTLTMRPFLSLTLAPSLGEHAIDRLVMDWAPLARAYTAMLGVYAGVLLLTLGISARGELHRTIRLGDE